MLAKLEKLAFVLRNSLRSLLYRNLDNTLKTSVQMSCRVSYKYECILWACHGLRTSSVRIQICISRVNLVLGRPT